MGYYIEVPQHQNKDAQLVELHGAVLSQPVLPPEGETLICVVRNGLFDAVGVVYDQDELDAFNSPGDIRPRTWLTLPTEKVLELCPEAERVL